MARARSLFAILTLPTLSLGPMLSLAACGPGGGSSTGGGADTEGGEAPPVSASETEGFDTEGFEAGNPSVSHGTGSAREMLGVNPPPTPWDQMSDHDQEWYMIAYVLPINAEMFRGYDANRYAAMECATCHGDDAAELHYAMPSRYLPAIPAPNTPAYRQAQERQAAAYAFMTDHVLPTIRTQLGKQDLTCFSCHPRAGS